MRAVILGCRGVSKAMKGRVGMQERWRRSHLFEKSTGCRDWNWNGWKLLRQGVMSDVCTLAYFCSISNNQCVETSRIWNWKWYLCTRTFTRRRIMVPPATHPFNVRMCTPEFDNNNNICRPHRSQHCDRKLWRGVSHVWYRGTNQIPYPLTRFQVQRKRSAGLYNYGCGF